MCYVWKSHYMKDRSKVSDSTIIVDRVPMTTPKITLILQCNSTTELWWFLQGIKMSNNIYSHLKQFLISEKGQSPVKYWLMVHYTHGNICTLPVSKRHKFWYYHMPEEYKASITEETVMSYMLCFSFTLLNIHLMIFFHTRLWVPWRQGTYLITKFSLSSIQQLINKYLFSNDLFSIVTGLLLFIITVNAEIEYIDFFLYWLLGHLKLAIWTTLAKNKKLWVFCGILSPLSLNVFPVALLLHHSAT